jgi:hypothetical protein
MSAFLPGRDLSRRFYEEAVRPLLFEYLAGIPYAAAHLGAGSDVLGFDTEMSRDHDWGPTVHIFLRDQDAHLAQDIRQMLTHRLPHSFYSYPVNFDETPVEPGTFGMKMTSDGPVNHRVHIMTPRAFFHMQLAYDIDHPPDVAAWLTIPSQSLREITTGAVHYDGVGELTTLRQLLAWYPHNVWLYLMACSWQRIGQEEHLMPRAGFVGDELGSALIASRLVRDMMSLCFLMEKQYAPYPKWFGTAFKQLSCADQLWPVLWQSQISSTWQDRESPLCKAYELLAHMHNSLGITQTMPENVSPFFNRPFKVIHGGDFSQALVDQITDNEVKGIAAKWLIGSIDQFTDNTDLRCVTSLRPILRKLYE